MTPYRVGGVGLARRVLGASEPDDPILDKVRSDRTEGYVTERGQQVDAKALLVPVAGAASDVQLLFEILLGPIAKGGLGGGGVDEVAFPDRQIGRSDCNSYR